ncbi:MAG: oligosaccharide flippase family protein [Arachnia sp.]
MASRAERGRPASERVSRGLGWSMTGNLTIRLGNVAASMIMARLIAPEQFGVFAVALTVWMILGTLAEFGLGTDIIRSKHPARIIPTVATIGLVASGLLALGMALGAPLIAASFSTPDAAGLISWMSIGLLLMGLSIVPSALLHREYRQGTLFAINAAGLVASLATMTTLALLGFGPVALVAGHLAQQSVALIGQLIATKFPLRLGWDPDIARASIKVSAPLAAANLVSWLLITVDNMLVARGMDSEALGFYLLAFNVSSWPMSAIGSSVRVVALPAFAHVEDEQLRNAGFVRASALVFAVGALIGTGLATMAPQVVQVLYGTPWLPAADALAGLAVFGITRVIFDLTATFLIARGSTLAVLAVQLVWIAAMVPAMILAIGWFGLAGAGWAHVAVALVIVVPGYLICLRRHGVRAAQLGVAMLRPALAAVVLALVLGLGVARIERPIVALLVAGAAGLGLYLAPLYRWGRGLVTELKAPSSEAS